MEGLPDDWTAVGRAVHAGDDAGLAELLAGGADPNERFLDRKRRGKGFFPLAMAVFRDRGEATRMLLERGAEKKKLECDGREWGLEEYARARGKTAALAALEEDERKRAAERKSGSGNAFGSQRAAGTSSVLRRGGGSGTSLRGAAGAAKNAGAAIAFSDLEMGEEIGKGAFGRVIRAKLGERSVACKVMTAVKEEKEQEQLRREIALQFAAKHPNIVEMIGLSKDADKNLIIVMELVEGGDLLSLLKNSAVALDWPLRARMAKELAGAISFLHARNVVHRDLKSENILVDGDFHLKLCDFGFARAVEVRGRATTVCGTPYYAAPEVLTGKPYDAKADVFAFGILVLELVTRRAVNLDRVGAREAQCPCGLDVAGLQKRLPKGIPAPLLKLGLVCAEWSGEKRPSMKQAEQMAGAIEKALAK